MLKIEFKYDLDKDVQNFLVGTRSKNSSKPTELQQAYINMYGLDYEESKIRDFLKSYIEKTGFDPERSIAEIEKSWRKIETEFMARTEKIFGISYPSPTLTAYITTNRRCTYNIEENYFFVSYASRSTNRNIMHEIFHFYTWHALHSDFIENGRSESQYNDAKESLTELLNIEFSDMLDGVRDDGYPQHAEMRERIKKDWNASKNLKKVVGLMPAK